MQLTFKILILYPNTLMNSCISSNHFSVGHLGFSVYKVTSSRQSLWVERVFFFLSDLDAYSLADTSKESTNCFSLQPPLFLNTSLDNFFILWCKRSQFFWWEFGTLFYGVLLFLGKVSEVMFCSWSGDNGMLLPEWPLCFGCYVPGGGGQ